MSIYGNINLFFVKHDWLDGVSIIILSQYNI
jgi:hypothetical protein